MDWLLPAIAASFGLIIGSFLNVVIHRGPALWNLLDGAAKRGNLAYPRSYCPTCSAPIRRAHLIPLFSYLALRGRCTNCAAPIPLRYPIVELFGAASAVTAVMLFGASITALFSALFFWFLIALAVIDLETGYLPDMLTLPLIGLGLTANALGLFSPLVSAVIGAVAGYASFRLIAAMFKKLRGIEGLGQGDAKLLAAIGAWLGWQALAPAIFIAAVLGLAAVLVSKLRGQIIEATTPIAFGPALAAAAAIAMVAQTLGLPAEVWQVF